MYPSRLKDLTGVRFGRLTAAQFIGKRRWECVCDCGVTTTVSTPNLTQGRTASCGCGMRQSSVERFTTHGNRHTREYASWAHAKQRCHNPKDMQYPAYGQRGIYMCDRWRNSFATFYDDMEPCPPRQSLDRIDNNGPYAPNNCRWTTKYVQCHNTRANRWITFRGVRKTLYEWGQQLFPSHAKGGRLIGKRLKAGWSLDRAMTEPVRRW